MTDFKNILPKPGDEVAGELPGAGDKVKNSRGTFLLWVLTVGATIMGGLAWVLYLSNKARLSEKDAQILACKEDVIKEQAENKELSQKLNDQTNKLERILAYGVSALEGVKQRTEQIESVVESNAKTINNTHNTLRNEASNN